MSRMQQILEKAEREGTVRRSPVAAPPAVEAPSAAAPAPAAPAMFRPRSERLDDREPFDQPRQPEADMPPEARPAIVEATLDRLLVAGVDPHSAAAEHYRGVRARLALHENGTPLRTLLVTSPAALEGKSVTAVNLALTMAHEIQRRVIVVDANLRRPRVHALLGLPDGGGLADVLTGAVDLDEAIVTIADHHLAVLPAGLQPRQPTELLGSAAMRRVTDTLRTRYDRVIIDMPAVAPLADVGTVAPLVDGVLLVVRAGWTTRPAIDAALAGFEPGKVVGVVLNGAR